MILEKLEEAKVFKAFLKLLKRKGAVAIFIKKQKSLFELLQLLLLDFQTNNYRNYWLLEGVH